MKGRKVSDQTADMVCELRRRGLSLRKIAQRAKISKSSVYRLTKGISWEQDSVQPKCAEMEKIARTKQPARPMAAPEPWVQRAKTETVADEDKSWLDQARVRAMQNRTSRPVRSEEAVKERYVCLTVQSKEDSELDQAEAYVRRIPRVSRLYELVDFLNRMDAMRTDDPMAKYRELRKKALSSAVMMMRLSEKCGSRATPELE